MVSKWNPARDKKHQDVKLLYGLCIACFTNAKLRRLDGFQAKCPSRVVRILSFVEDLQRNRLAANELEDRIEPITRFQNQTGQQNLAWRCRLSDAQSPFYNWGNAASNVQEYPPRGPTPHEVGFPSFLILRTSRSLLMIRLLFLIMYICAYSSLWCSSFWSLFFDWFVQIRTFRLTCCHQRQRYGTLDLSQKDLCA